MSEEGYYKLDDLVYYGDIRQNITAFEWFNTFPFGNKKQFLYVLRTPLTEENVRYLVMDIFPKIFSINVEFLKATILGDGPEIKTFLITFKLYYEDFWDDVVDKLFLYCMAFLNTMGFHVLSIHQPYFNSFEDNFMLAIKHGNYTISPEKFFNSSMA
ncbi:hypothetical protein LCGC14_2768570, partial [marine sediment metagenome]